MSMWMYGTFSDEDRENWESPYIYFSSREKGDEFDGIIYEDGWGNLYDVISLWDLLGSDKGQALKKLLKNEIEVDDNTDEDGSYLISIENIKRMLDLGEGLKQAILEITYESGYVRPEKVDYVLAKAPLIVSKREYTKGNWQYTLDEPIGKADGVLWFLRHALRLERDVRIG